VALVSGASSGIGRAVALALGGPGRAVLVNHRDSARGAEQTAERVRATGAEALVVQGDVSCDQDCRALVRAAQQRWGRLDVLINNAGTTAFVDLQDLEGLGEQCWDRILAVNLKGPFFLARAAAPALRAARGAIVNVSSTAALNALGSSIAYSASKAALNNLTLSLARALAPEVRVNAVAPGFVDTPWLERGLGEKLEGARKWVRGRTPSGELVRPEQVAGAVLGLLDMEQVTGQIVVVDGGFLLRG
jgi:3-oxoacyl-[acyl-carrier protein] reductase